MTHQQRYEEIIQSLSNLPYEFLLKLDNAVQVKKSSFHKTDNPKKRIMSFIGSWNDLSQEDFEDIIEVGKKSSNELFTREIELSTQF